MYLFHFALRNHCIQFITTDTLHIIGTQLHNNLATCIYRMDTKCLHNYYIKDHEIGHVTVYIEFKDEIALLTATKTNVKKMKNLKHEKQKI